MGNRDDISDMVPGSQAVITSVLRTVRAPEALLTLFRGGATRGGQAAALI